MSNQGFVVAEFPDGIQVIPKIWLQNKDECKYPSHFKTDIKIRKAVEKQEIPKFDWPALEVIRIFGEYSSLQKAYAKAEKALYTSDMDTEKEAKYYRKHRARKIYSSSESEEESGVNLPPAPCPPAKHQRLNDSDVSRIQCKTTSNVRSSEKSQSSQITNSSSHSSFLQASPINEDRNGDDFGASCETDAEEHMPRTIIAPREKTRDGLIHAHGRSDNEYSHNSPIIKGKNRINSTHNRYDTIDPPLTPSIGSRHNDNDAGKIGRATKNKYTYREIEKEKENFNNQFSHAEGPIVDHLKKLTREVASVKYDVRQILTLVDIIVDKINKDTECERTQISFEGAENRFPLQTVVQLAEVEEILKASNSQHNTEIRGYIKSIGGTSVDDAVKRTLYKVFSNKLAERYNWEGRRGKEPLQKLEVMKVIFRSILHNIPDSDQRKIQRRVMEWFRHSKARHENEEKRMNRREAM
ncbi:uncharacterized protein LOC114932125 [Nylanderia fulva]|uniref:uncharacterized protein LOC114928606 n=1 Tax=Nylanderia fulva TaxID=613905 RepID=UPI0010FB76E8|nr:uncharacterized protein LOC114928606 [Nylanderia fulva]XP_029157994.1 uncharacterized protein LOC114930398 [Nylanderia fulva]XP_029160134.1 uncharacterized protein LOC114932125 [Nylanderia fulva]